MRKNFMVRISAVLSSAVMAFAACAFTASAAESTHSDYCIELSDAETLAGKVVNVDLNMYSNNECEGYTIAVEYDSALEFRRVNGDVTYSNYDNMVYITGFSTGTIKDGKVGSITFVAPEDAMEGETYSVKIANVENFGTMSEPIFDGFTVENSDITVLGQATKTSEKMVYVEETSTSIEVVVGVRGDFNNDGKVNIFDAVAVAKASTSKKVTVSASSQFFGNVNEDSSLNIFDAVNIARYSTNGDWAATIG